MKEEKKGTLLPHRRRRRRRRKYQLCLVARFVYRGSFVQVGDTSKRAVGSPFFFWRAGGTINGDRRTGEDAR